MGDVLYPGGVSLTDAQHTALQLQGLHSEGGAVSEAGLAVGQPVVVPVEDEDEAVPGEPEPEAIDSLGNEPGEATDPNAPVEEDPAPQPEIQEPEIPLGEDTPEIVFEPSDKLIDAINEDDAPAEDAK